MPVTDENTRGKVEIMTDPRVVSGLGLLDSIPVEIIQRILEWIDYEDRLGKSRPSSLSQVELTSKALAELVKPIKYRHLELGIVRVQDCLFLLQHILPLYGHHVQTLSLNEKARGIQRNRQLDLMALQKWILTLLNVNLRLDDDPVLTWRDQYDCVLPVVLHSMPNLKSFMVQLPYQDGGMVVPNVKHLSSPYVEDHSFAIEHLSSPLRHVSAKIETLEVRLGSFQSQAVKFHQDIQRFKQLRRLSLTGFSFKFAWDARSSQLDDAMKSLSCVQHLDSLVLQDLASNSEPEANDWSIGAGVKEVKLIRVHVRVTLFNRWLTTWAPTLEALSLIDRKRPQKKVTAIPSSTIPSLQKVRLLSLKKLEVEEQAWHDVFCHLIDSPVPPTFIT
ncbi:hypothetical protein OIO90_005804 [Microbotryomycetes sp. JL221]|nr:hypothetical protein OIO90_005804 [Microbotryomycetes sp. JL221]